MTAGEEREGESLDDRLAAEEPDVPDAIEPVEDLPRRAHRGQVDGTPRTATRCTTSSTSKSVLACLLQPT